jgi:adenosylcobinamide amidohydrolase
MLTVGPDEGVPVLVEIRPSGGATGQCLVWRFEQPMLAISSAIVGGGIGAASWVINVTVEPDYSRMNPPTTSWRSPTRLASADGESAS